jgi:hypothetical protein
MRLPQNPIRWLLTILFIALVGLTAWIVWALDKLEERRAAKKATPVEQKTAPAAETPSSKPSNSKE